MKPGTYRRLALVAPLVLLGLAFFLDSVHGQRMPPRPRLPTMPQPPRINPNPMPGIGPRIPMPGMGPQIPNPGLGGNLIEKVWTCSGCGKEIGRNTPFPPGSCPHCGAKIVNGIGPPGPTGPAAPMPMVPPGMPQMQPPVFNPNPGMPGGVPNPNPAMPGMPVMPGMPGFNPNPGTQPPMPNVNETVWTCSRCNKELARNTVAPPSRCPHCGAKIMNGVGPDPGPPASVSPVSSWFSSDSSSSSSSGSGKSKFSGKVIALVVGIVVLGILALLGGTFLMIYTMKSGSSAPTRRRRRARDDYDD